MYELIKKLCATKGISPTKLCTEIAGSKGNLPTWQKGNINPISLIKIADYFNISANYLLGRTDNPQGINQINTGDVGDNSNVNVNTSKEKFCSDTSELFEIISNLSIIDRAKVILFIDELKNK